LRQLNHIDAFNEGARRNASILTELLHDVPGIEAPAAVEGDHIYVYYPLTVDPAKRDDLRHHLLKNGFDTKTSDMSDCTALKPFQVETPAGIDQNPPKEASILEICVYPVSAQTEMRRLGNTVRSWAGLTVK
jgi:dTDP-4-amino-4,6-dideoxygalactose transaminase